MKLNFSVEVEQDNDVYSLQDEILYKASETLIHQVLGNTYDKTDLGEKLKKAVIEKLEVIMDVDFKKSVGEKVTENLANKFEKTKQYKSLIGNEEVLSDGLIKTGLRDLVGEIVRSEMKKVFR